MEFGAESSGRNFRLCTVQRGAADSPIFLCLGHPAASSRVAAAAVTRRVQRYTNADSAILGSGVESSSPSSFRRARLPWRARQSFALARQPATVSEAGPQQPKSPRTWKYLAAHYALPLRVHPVHSSNQWISALNLSWRALSRITLTSPSAKPLGASAWMSNVSLTFAPCVR
jgi:hypothetical protein